MHAHELPVRGRELAAAALVPERARPPQHVELRVDAKRAGCVGAEADPCWRAGLVQGLAGAESRAGGGAGGVVWRGGVGGCRFGFRDGDAGVSACFLQFL